MSYRLVTLYSGSGGNCIYFSVGKTSILIDAGKSAKALCTSLSSIGADISEISAIFITHEHCDHVSALETLCKKHSIPVHLTEGSAEKFDRTPCSSVLCRAVRHPTVFCETVGEVKVTSFRTPHDSRMSVGYRIEFTDGDGYHAVGVATDIGHVTDSIVRGLEGCEAVVLEANHDLDMLADGPYPHHLKVRIRSPKGHLSNPDSAQLAAHLVSTGTKGFILAHLSAENNLPEIAYDEVYAAISDESVRLWVASPDSPTELILDKAVM